MIPQGSPKKQQKEKKEIFHYHKARTLIRAAQIRLNMFKKKTPPYVPK
jgi:hypothetical protein